MYIYKLVFLSLVLFSQLANANDIPKITKNVVGIFNVDTNKAVNTRDVYGDVINYYIPPEINTITIHSPNDGDVSIDLQSEIEFVISEWREAGLRFNRLSSIQGTTRYIGYRLGNDASAYGYTNFNEPREGDAITRLSLDPSGFTRFIPDYYRRLMRAGMISSNMTMHEFIRMMVRVTLLHETGHALGLAHHDENGHEFIGGMRVGREIVRCGINISRPSIMQGGSSGSYLSLVSQFLSRPVNINDVVLSRNDLEGADRMFNSHNSRGVVSLFCMAVFMSMKGSEL
ncbi:hypothetical protein GNP80_11215 [Aliivibrio fischeri]|uniref:hypothetical protein n=1 Tax=Aliivibrio fischeri TaxID=668 RepID=UPI0012DA859A|nr:hypothetical protein [Aliivibrio fischeri]MUK93012.1 hypothetical protein [Aliivibrio fischeri]